jgi:protein-arginine kinase activator protein McsA
MERKTIMVEALGAPKHVVQQIETRPKTTAVCPLCRTRFKKDDPTVLIDLVKKFRIAPEQGNQPEQVIRISICEPCAQPAIKQRREALDDLIKLLAKLVVEDVMKDADSKHK